MTKTMVILNENLESVQMFQFEARTMYCVGDSSLVTDMVLL